MNPKYPIFDITIFPKTDFVKHIQICDGKGLTDVEVANRLRYYFDYYGDIYNAKVEVTTAYMRVKQDSPKGRLYILDLFRRFADEKKKAAEAAAEKRKAEIDQLMKRSMEEANHVEGDVFTTGRGQLGKTPGTTGRGQLGRTPGTTGGEKAKPAPAAPQREIHSMIRPLSSTNRNVQYRTVLYTDGSAHCTCEGFRYRETCRHLNLLRQDYVVAK